jgi:hypothetical protein
VGAGQYGRIDPVGEALDRLRCGRVVKSDANEISPAVRVLERSPSGAVARCVTINGNGRRYEVRPCTTVTTTNRSAAALCGNDAHLIHV